MSGDRWRKGPVDDFPNRKEVPWPLGVPIRSAAGGDGGRSDTAEIPNDPDGLLWVRRPHTEGQALMEAAPGDATEESIEAQGVLRELLADAVASLDPELLWVFQAHVNRGLSFNEIARELSCPKTTVYRRWQSAQRSLQRSLAGHPVVARRLVK